MLGTVLRQLPTQHRACARPRSRALNSRCSTATNWSGRICHSPHPEIQVASIIALVDFDGRHRRDASWCPAATNGPSEREVHGPRKLPSQKCPPAPPCVYPRIHDSRRRTEYDARARGGAACTSAYTVGWLRTEENQMPERAARDRAQACRAARRNCSATGRTRRTDGRAAATSARSTSWRRPSCWQTDASG